MTSYPVKDYKNIRADIIQREKLTLDAVFVPFSQSRNKDNKDLSLNWKVTLKRNGREVLTTDYIQGIGHASCKAMRDKYARTICEKFEAENGKKSFWMENISKAMGTKPLDTPTIEDVLYSLLMDSDVLDSPTYEEWAGNLGYDEDSGSGERIYRACLEIALKMRAGLGDSVLTELKEAFTDY